MRRASLSFDEVSGELVLESEDLEKDVSLMVDELVLSLCLMDAQVVLKSTKEGLEIRVYAESEKPEVLELTRKQKNGSWIIVCQTSAGEAIGAWIPTRREEEPQGPRDQG